MDWVGMEMNCALGMRHEACGRRHNAQRTTRNAQGSGLSAHPDAIGWVFQTLRAQGVRHAAQCASRRRGDAIGRDFQTHRAPNILASARLLSEEERSRNRWVLQALSNRRFQVSKLLSLPVLAGVYPALGATPAA